MTPDAFLNDWYGYATNQSGHFLLGLIAVFFLYMLFRSARRSIALTMVVYTAWEVTQLMRGGTMLDGVEDALFVLAGGLFAAGAVVLKREFMLLSLMVTIIAMVNGVMRRKK